jgi:hypothetical protein
VSRGELKEIGTVRLRPDSDASPRPLAANDYTAITQHVISEYVLTGKLQNGQKAKARA